MKTTVLTKDAIQELLLDFLCQQFLVEKEDIELDKSLVDTGIIDSMGLIEISAYLQREYEIKITEEKMNRNNFGSVVKIVDFILREKDIN
ncbi:MAG: acyl carrier protein [Prolixibacteraceae bacterium]|jgi:acyl carrier protein|nr:acyl carrier protein [Prolixibacteraceae bacterium]